MGKKAYLAVLVGCCALAAAGCSRTDSPAGEVPQQAQESVNMAKVQQDLAVIAEARILFGHQSVGRNVLAGLDELIKESGAPVRVVQIDGLPPDDQPGIFHSNIGQNGDPDGKCEVFSHLLTRPEKPAYDVALMKFCYADLDVHTPLGVDQMLERYERTVRDVRTQRPDVRLVHVTVPLVAEPQGRKTWVKRLLGREVDGDSANRMRNQFNAKLRERFAGEPIFDIASLESTLPDGSRVAFAENGQQIYMLAREYTTDGGHLNPAARRRAAAEFVSALASVVQDQPAS